jgi:hypothetical protein
MDHALKMTVARGSYAVDPHAVAAAMLASGRAPIPLKRPSDVLVSAEIVDGLSTGAGQDQPGAFEGTA